MIVRKLITFTTDPKIARQISELTAQVFQVAVVRSADAIQAALRSDPAIAVLIIDHPPEVSAADAVRLLELAQESRPDVRRGLLTGYGDVGAVIRALHGGAAQFVLQRSIVAAEVLAALTQRGVIGPTSGEARNGYAAA